MDEHHDRCLQARGVPSNLEADDPRNLDVSYIPSGSNEKHTLLIGVLEQSFSF